MKYTYRAIVERIVDGDTLRVSVDLGFGVWLHDITVRLFGIDAPERDTEAGRTASERLRVRLKDQEIVLQTIKDRTGKYGRWLGIVYHKEENINMWLLGSGLAVPYPTRKKPDPVNTNA